MIQKSIAISAFLFSLVWAQFETPVILSASQKEDVRSGEVATIIVKAEMDDEWRI